MTVEETGKLGEPVNPSLVILEDAYAKLERCELLLAQSEARIDSLTRRIVVLAAATRQLAVRFDQHVQLVAQLRSRLDQLGSAGPNEND